MLNICLDYIHITVAYSVLTVLNVSEIMVLQLTTNHVVTELFKSRWSIRSLWSVTTGKGSQCPQLVFIKKTRENTKLLCAASLCSYPRPLGLLYSSPCRSLILLEIKRNYAEIPKNVLCDGCFGNTSWFLWFTKPLITQSFLSSNSRIQYRSDG